MRTKKIFRGGDLGDLGIERGHSEVVVPEYRCGISFKRKLCGVFRTQGPVDSQRHDTPDRRFQNLCFGLFAIAPDFANPTLRQ